jgi:hypothetical protein
VGQNIALCAHPISWQSNTDDWSLANRRRHFRHGHRDHHQHNLNCLCPARRCYPHALHVPLIICVSTRSRNGMSMLTILRLHWRSTWHPTAPFAFAWSSCITGLTAEWAAWHAEAQLIDVGSISPRAEATTDKKQNKQRSKGVGASGTVTEH